MSTTEQQREKNRREMPSVAAVIDQFNAMFGPVKVLAAEDFETGKKVGTFPDELRTRHPQ